MSITWKRSAPVAVLVSTLVTAGLGPAYASDGGGSKGLLDQVTSVVTGDVVGGVVDSTWGDDTTKEGKQASRGAGGWDATQDMGSMFSLTRSIGAQSAWARGVTGNGVTVALIDTGVVGVPGLEKDDKVTDGPDLSFESQSAGTRYLDGFGHGTHLAGIIAGKDDGFDPKKPQGTQFAGVAPDAKLLNMKVATGDGGADVTQVIAALDWVVEHRDDQGMNVRVVNLSYGTTSDQPWQVDPLARAVENAWNHDILVVTSAGNDGLDAPSLLMPAVDPHVLAVGASDHRGSNSAVDDRVADFTNGGSSARRPDLLAPGKSVVSLRDPGSFIDTAHPEGLVPQDEDHRFFRGSGTSQAAAVVSGEAALLFSARPKLTADQAKAVLMQTATPLVFGGPAQGRGVADVGAAVTAVKAGLVLPTLNRSLPDSTGLGTLEASRGGEHVVDPETGTPLAGEVDAIGSRWNPATWVAAQNAGKTWVGGAWNGQTWTGTKWDKRQLQGVAWTGTSWSGLPWTAHSWPTDQFQARSWRGDNWKARSWRGDNWKARSWRGQP
ncbi:MAG: peptidase and in kexin sedolisin [Marmoricola sp.]|nr:peptidase and in kexin sedolisin [Marmoricola sp.]